MLSGPSAASTRGSVRPALLSLSVLLAACTGASRSTSLSGTSPAPAPDAFECLRTGLKAVDFDQTSYDTDELRITARRFDDTQRRPDVQFRRIVDRLEIQVAPGSGEAVTTIAVDAKTFAEYTTHRGPTEEQEKTSTTAQEAARTLLQKCSGPVDSTSVPG